MTRTNDKAIKRTDEVIRRLSAQAGSARLADMPLERALGLGLALSLAAALLIVSGMPGLRPGLAGLAMTWVFQFKIIAMALLACGGAVLVRAAGIPGTAATHLLALSPGMLFLLAGALFDRSDFPVLGARQMSVPLCVGAIVAASLPGLVFIMAGLRRGIPTRPTLAGAAAGFLSGTIGALAYALACVNDGAAFVAIWYMAGIAIATACGAAIGRRALAW